MNQNILNNLKEIEFLGMKKIYDVDKSKDARSNRFEIKKIYLKNINLKENLYVKKEIRILEIIRHPNIIKFYKSFQIDDILYIILEYCNGGTIQETLEKYIAKNGKPFPGKNSESFNETNINRN